MPIFLSCPHCQTTTPLGAPLDFARPIVCSHCGEVLEDFSRQMAPAAPVVQTRGASARSRPTQQPSVVGHLLGVVAGGLAGLAVGYYLLNLLGGPQFDWLKVPLPGVPHTERHRSLRGDGWQSDAWPATAAADEAPAWTPEAQPAEGAAPAAADYTDLPAMTPAWPASSSPAIAPEPLPQSIGQAAPLAPAESAVQTQPPLAPSPVQTADGWSDDNLSGENPWQAVPAGADRSASVGPSAAEPGQLPVAATNALPIESAPSTAEVDAVDPFAATTQTTSQNVDVFAPAAELVNRRAGSAAETATDAPVLGLTGAPAVPLEQLARALREAELRLHCRQCGGTGMVGPPPSAVVRAAPTGAPAELLPCRQCSGRRVDNVPAEGYRQLCDLAEAATLVQADATEETQQLRLRLQTLLLACASNRDLLNSLGRQAAYRLEQPVRPLEGVALVGTVTELGRAGSLYFCRMVLFGAPRAVTVLSAAPLDARVRDRAAVLGVIVTDPNQQLVGYAGPDDTTVWGGFRVAWAP